MIPESVNSFLKLKINVPPTNSIIHTWSLAYMMKLVAAPAMKMEIVAFAKRVTIFTTSAIAKTMTPNDKAVMVTKRLQTTSLWLDRKYGYVLCAKSR